MIDDRFLRDREVGRITGLGKTQRTVGIAEGWFPAPRRIGARAKGWLESEILGWMRTRPVIGPKEEGADARKLDAELRRAAGPRR